MSNQVDWEEVLEVFLWALDKFTRPTFNNLMASLEEARYRAYGPKWFHQLEAARALERQAEGRDPIFAVAEKIKRASLAGRDPRSAWEEKWDGRWRLLTFDIPQTRSKDRLRLWRHLSARNLGHLQRSVWIWPRDLRPLLSEILQATEIPECFAGFDASQLFLCSHAQLVAAGWDWESLTAGHREYLDRVREWQGVLKRAPKFAALAEAGRSEWRLYRAAMERDPLLPEALLPSHYLGRKVHQEHQEFRRQFGRVLRSCVAPPP